MARVCLQRQHRLSFQSGLTSYMSALVLDGVHGYQCNWVLDAALQMQRSLLSGLPSALVIYYTLASESERECVGFLQAE